MNNPKPIERDSFSNIFSLLVITKINMDNGIKNKCNSWNSNEIPNNIPDIK